MTQLSLDFTRRDAALAKVATNAGRLFFAGALEALDGMTADEFSGEDLTLACKAAGLVPHHVNAFGSLVAWLVNKGLITQTGRMVNMRVKTSNARKTPTYIKVQG